MPLLLLLLQWGGSFSFAVIVVVLVCNNYYYKLLFLASDDGNTYLPADEQQKNPKDYAVNKSKAMVVVAVCLGPLKTNVN